MRPFMSLHAFVVMPYGRKQDIDFDRVYRDFIRPALEKAGFQAFRSDEEVKAGNIRAEMFQELLLADLVIADISIDNPNVWYELGVRHALKARGVVIAHCGRDVQPFDTYTDRKLHYHLKDGAPDPARLEEDIRSLAAMAARTAAAWHGERISPVFYHLPNLQEPDWKTLRVGNAVEFWEIQGAWEQRVEEARLRNRPGNILVLAEEAPVEALLLEACRKAARALRGMGQFGFALEQAEKALAIKPDDLESQREKGMLLGKMGRREAAKAWLEDLRKKHPRDAETAALFGRIVKETWMESWKLADIPARRREAAAGNDGLLREALEAYLAGFRCDPCHYYSGINALTLSHLLRHLTGTGAEDRFLRSLGGGVRWAVECALNAKPDDYWARATLGDLEVLEGEAAEVSRAYRDAVAVAAGEWFSLDSTYQQLRLLASLDFRREQVEAGIEVFRRALASSRAPERREPPSRVLLFSGHMVDAEGRPTPRFPPEKEPIAKAAITERLEGLRAAAGDLGLCGGACGGDLLFAEECLARGMRLELYLPFPEAEFLRNSVSFAGSGWSDRFYRVRRHERVRTYVMPEELGPCPGAGNPYRRNNLWLLFTALSHGQENVHFLCLWNGAQGDGPGGTAHMYEEVGRRTGQVHWIDTRRLW